MAKTITIDPVTRLEGHGKITICLNDAGDVDRAFFQVPELRGFEAFCVGRQAEDMPQITSRICGVCPTAHHMAATRALDDLFQVTPPPAAHAIRKLFYNLFMFEDHLLNFYYLGGPDFIVGPDAPAADRNILGVIQTVGVATATKVIEIRNRCRDLMAWMGGKVVHPVLGLPGGVSKAITEEKRQELRGFASDAVAFAGFTLDTFHSIVLDNPTHVALIGSENYFERTNYMGLVDAQNRVDFYEQDVRVVDDEGREIERFAPRDYASVIAEHVEPWTYIKFPYLRKRGWLGFRGGAGSSLVRVAPLGRLNAAEGMQTPRAQEEHDRLYATLGGKPAHHTLAWHWARLVEVMQAAETVQQLAKAPELTDPHIRNLDLKTPTSGVGIVEAPRGMLVHHYETDANGVVTAANLLVATLFNSAAICMSIEKAARGLIKGGRVEDGMLNRVEMAFRAYDPCFSCATHHLPGHMALTVQVRAASGETVVVVTRDDEGRETRTPAPVARPPAARSECRRT
ncbi:MAG: F420-nonreducing hydrogenase [Lentisphaerae bacterium RIFOXYB12_FULL_65_16]|nr:MAG: F420-nonreducing hydrogenase [Lentisphaerae bacterium RIFOXYA12_64_32]OGV93577.1 MAG: F420-nonreducing hydrogenase [Lentisphaerae bacterium RIFOXYB12_FULL_65_16]